MRYLEHYSRWLRAGVLSAILFSLVAPPARADEGMWLLNNPPLKTLKEKYNFEPKPEWFEHLQKSAVRFETGGSGSIVSPYGLVMTNHHVGEDMLEKLSTPERNLHSDGYHAKTMEQELRCPDLELNVLWEIEDVTARVNEAAAGKEGAAANDARRAMISTIEAESEAASGLNSEVVTLYRGARYHLYRYKQYTDVRLVFAPERGIAFFGGDTDNFEYPRYCLDVCFFRIYENDQPLRPQHYLKWSEAGVNEGDLVLVVGHPANTRRLNTVDHLKFIRDLEMPFTLNRLRRREVQLQGFMARNPENERIGSSEYLSVQNSRKAFTGMYNGLLDPQLMRRKVEAENALRAAVARDSERGAELQTAWSEISTALGDYREFYERYQAMRVSSDLFNIALHLVRLAAELPKPSAERLPEYNDAALDSLRLAVLSPAPIYDELEIDRITSRITFMCEQLGADDPAVRELLDGKAPRELAFQLVKGTSLKDVEVRTQMSRGGREAIDASGDPLIRFAAKIDPYLRELRKRYEDRVQAVETSAYAKIAAAHFAAFGENVYPDATFTLRLAFGQVKGYPEDGQAVPPFTTLGGLYERNWTRSSQPNYQLPPRWLERRDRLNLETPFNFVSNADIIGGNSGSPTVNRDGEVVGLIFDGNIHSLILDIIFDDQQSRALSVDARGILEALRKVYEADELVRELTQPAKR